MDTFTCTGPKKLFSAIISTPPILSGWALGRGWVSESNVITKSVVASVPPESVKFSFFIVKAFVKFWKLLNTY